MGFATPSSNVGGQLNSHPSHLLQFRIPSFLVQFRHHSFMDQTSKVHLKFNLREVTRSLPPLPTSSSPFTTSSRPAQHSEAVAVV